MTRRPRLAGAPTWISHPATLTALLATACTPGIEVPLPIDGGLVLPDASSPDAGDDDDAGLGPDGGALDGGALDGGALDGGASDAGFDAGPVFGDICDAEPAGFPPRPLWSDIPAVPDYQKVSNNLNAADTVKLLASMIEKATSELEGLQNDITLEEAEGVCACTPVTPLPSCTGGQTLQKNDITKADCQTHCAALSPTCGDGTVLAWVGTEVFKDRNGAVRAGLRQVGFLDEVVDLLQAPAFSNTVGAFSSVSQWLENLAEVMTLILDYLDTFTEGYHLGAYSEQRPDLHMCVGYGGHGAYAQMGNLGGGSFSIGSRYTSHNLSAEHRAQLRTGGFSAVAFDRPLSILPGVEATLQMDGFRLWDASKPFGIPLGSGSLPLSAVDDVDIFNLVDQTEAAALDTTPAPSGDGQLQAGELLITGYTPFTFQRAPDPTPYEWPREDVDAEWEGFSSAVFGLGLNLDLHTKPLERTLPPIPIVPGATLIPYFRLKAGIGWDNEAYLLRDTIQAKVNQNIPPALHLTAADFARDMHDMQAPDVTGDNGSHAYVRPEIGADLLLGLQIAKFLRMGVFARLGVGAHAEPHGFGGVVDMNHALVDAMNHSNPPPEAECTAIWEQDESESCSNELFEDSIGEYGCAPAPSDGSCCIQIGGRSLCLEEYTGITEKQCSAHAKAGDLLETIKPYLTDSLYAALAPVVDENYFSATWNEGKTCAESCDSSVPLPDLVNLSACEQRGYCVVTIGDEEQVFHDVTASECEKGYLHQQRCVATYEDNPLGLVEEVGPGGNGEQALYPFVHDYVPTSIPVSVGGLGFSAPQHRATEVGKAQDVADTLESAEACTEQGWCYGFARAPGLTQDAFETMYVTSYLGVAADAADCPTSQDAMGDILDDYDDPLPRQFVPFTWQSLEFGDGTPGVFTPYQCVSDITPKVVGWEGPGCHPLTNGFPSACGCSSDSDCVSGETCVEGQCTDGSSSCECDPDGPNTCAAGRVCDDGACMKPCTNDGDCPAYQVCSDDDTCAPMHGIQTAEQIHWGMQNVDAPMHAINTYALSELEAYAYLTAGIRLEMILKIFRKTKKFTLWDWKDFWEIASLNKVWYQPGLQANYQHDCSPELGGVINHQPQMSYVDRYPDPALDTSYDDTEELLDWCKPVMQDDVQDPDTPTVDDIQDGLGDVLDWGTDIGLDVWNGNQLCINGQLWSEYLSNANGSLENADCSYDDPVTQQSHSFPCRELQHHLLNIWGCLDANRTATASALAAHFNGSGGFNALGTYNGVTVFVPSLLQVDPLGALEASNIQPVFLSYGGSQGHQWLNEVEQCFNSRYEPESACSCTTNADCDLSQGQYCGGGVCHEPGGARATCAVVTLDVEPGPCCGDGVRQAHEECDDGNLDDGDGCSSSCELGDDVTGACCTFDGGCFDHIAPNECEGQGTFSLGTCADPGVCAAASGCCCHADGADTLSADECAGIGGSYAGDGVACTADTCGDPTPGNGACCTPDGDCVIHEEPRCAEAGGVYQGDDTVCEPGLTCN